MIRFLTVALFCLILPLSALAQDDTARSKIFNAEYFTLDNGMEIVVIPNHRAPVVTHMVWYRVGSADEPVGKSGIAHVLEHLMFKGSGDLDPGEFSKTVRALGGKDNAFTSRDYTAYYQSVAIEHLETVMNMEAGRMRGLSPPLEEVESERLVILEERRQRTDNNPNTRLQEQMITAIFVNHPYGTPIIGWLHEMEKLSWEDAKTFYDQWYGPNNAVLIVTGDVTGEQVHDLAKKIYGPIEPLAQKPEPEFIKSPPLSAESKVTLHDPAVRQPTLQIAFRAPSYAQSKKDALALTVMAEIMGGGPASRLYKSLVFEQKLASNVSLSYRDSARSDAVVWFHVTPNEDTTIESVELALRAEINKLIDEGVTEQELKEAVTRLQSEAIYARDSLSGPAFVFGHALTTGSTIDDVEYWTDNIEGVTQDNIRNVAAQFLNIDENRNTPVVIGYLLPQDEQDSANE